MGVSETYIVILFVRFFRCVHQGQGEIKAIDVSCVSSRKRSTCERIESLTSFRIANLTLQVIVVLFLKVFDAFPVTPLGICVNVHLDYTVTD